ncbi:MAG: lytic transglycosylase domain-containing protein [Thermohalobaculum sp.]|nr:lytic transglycosylase domain-containing protein [Thermohalobaculum sp.]
MDEPGAPRNRDRLSGAARGCWSIGAALMAIWLSCATAGARPPQIAEAEPGASSSVPSPDGGGAVELCHLIETSATAHGLPPEFFARLIWKESRFDARAVSPKGAQGVAQFMPATARLRGLGDPFDPAQAVPASAAYLAELRVRFGNLGLAAAAYNAGEDRVARYLGGAAGLPGETLDYVLSITFRPAAWFRAPGREVEPRPLDAARTFHTACRDLPVMKTRAVLFEGAPWKPWGVQVAGHIRRAVAMGQFARVQARHARIIGDHAPMVVQARVGTGARRIWSVRLGADSRSEAVRLCARLRVAGGACMVRRN